MIFYVVGFTFVGNQVLLIKKTRPEWQRERYNGIGGKIEQYESSVQAMVREFKEETGVVTEWYDWEEFAFLESVKNDWQVHCYRAFFKDIQPKSITEEEVKFVNVANLYQENVIPNLRWLIPLALDKDIKRAVHLIDYGHN